MAAPFLHSVFNWIFTPFLKPVSKAILQQLFFSALIKKHPYCDIGTPTWLLFQFTSPGIQALYRGGRKHKWADQNSHP